MARRRVIVRVEGTVQGVYFRDYTQQEARRLDLSGWVRNRPDGSVEAVLEGEEKQVETMLSWLERGSPMADVKKVTATDEKVQDVHTAFSIRYN